MFPHLCGFWTMTSFFPAFLGNDVAVVVLKARISMVSVMVTFLLFQLIGDYVAQYPYPHGFCDDDHSLISAILGMMSPWQCSTLSSLWFLWWWPFFHFRCIENGVAIAVLMTVTFLLSFQPDWGWCCHDGAQCSHPHGSADVEGWGWGPLRVPGADDCHAHAGCRRQRHRSSSALSGHYCLAGPVVSEMTLPHCLWIRDGNLPQVCRCIVQIFVK